MTIADSWVESMQQAMEVPRTARLRLTKNGLTLVPVTHAHRTTRRRIENQIEERLPGWTPGGRVRGRTAQGGLQTGA